jgi:hypothetical protein
MEIIRFDTVDVIQESQEASDTPGQYDDPNEY